MSDHVDRAAEVILRGQGIVALRHDEAAAYARLLDAAGLLASPERDAAVAARALRDAADEVYGDDRAAGPYSHPLSGASWLRDRADRIDPTRGEASG